MTPNPLFADRLSAWAELDELRGKPEFAADLTGIDTTYRRLQAFGRLLGPAQELHRRPERLLAGMEWAGIVDPAMMHAAMVHFGVATTAFVECGHPNDDLDPLLAELDSVEAPGTIVATELGRGGSQVNMRTEARYHRDRRTFTLHTPDDAALKIMPNVGWTGLPRTAVVNARLIVDGTDHGVHAFAFRFPHPGAEVSRLPGGAPVPLDYSVIRFQHAEIPFGYWLSDDVTITDDGVDDPLPAGQRVARSLGGVNAAVTFAAVALTSAARAAVAIAVRYNTQRLIGYPGTPAFDFPAHRSDLASAVARTYATGFYVDKVRRDFIDERLNTAATGTTEGAEDASYAPWLAANRDRTLAKAAATMTLEAVAASSRRLCGFQGLLHVNRIAVYEDMARSFHAAGGDTRLLLLEAGKQLVQSTDTPAVTASVGTDIDATRLISLHERVLAAQLRNGADHTDHLRDIERLARVHVVRRTLEEFDAAITTVEGQWRTILDATRRLYGIDVLLDSAAWHLNHGSLRPGDIDILDEVRSSAVEHVIEHLDALIDGLAVPPGRAGGFIGQTDYIDSIASSNKPNTTTPVP